MPLHLQISTGSTTPIYRQIADQICHAVATRDLAPGEQLPSVRALAEQLVINPNTVARIYSQLIRDGVLEAQQGKGVFVAARRRTVYTKAERLRRIKDSLEAFVSQGVYLGFTPPELRDLLDARLAPLKNDVPAPTRKGALSDE